MKRRSDVWWRGGTDRRVSVPKRASFQTLAVLGSVLDPMVRTSSFRAIVEILPSRHASSMERRGHRDDTP